MYPFLADEIVLNVTIQKSSGNFEITTEKSILVTGKVYSPENINMEFVNKSTSPLKNGFADREDTNYTSLNSDDVYKELRIRGYNYKNEFKSIVQVEKNGNIDLWISVFMHILSHNSIIRLGSYGKIAWKNNYVTFLDNMLQFKILKDDTRKLKVPISIERIVIDAKQHLKSLENETLRK